ncbi:MAG: WG repeat-containing protein [Candidatus Kapabacteria bacterium]|nr:WG repeat-containing protein [Ignavibacteriota bacterium]MCW5883795.1 WG repeat-containing protein [Candidatus Kapabacteria bacterium]
MKKLVYILLILFPVILFAELFPVVDGKKIGYIDIKGNLVIPFDFECNVEYAEIVYQNRKLKTFNLPASAYFNEGLATVIKKSYFWFIPLGADNVLIDNKGEIVLNSKSLNLGKFSCGRIPLAVRNKIVDVYVEYYSYCDKSGAFTDNNSYDFAGTYHEDFAVVMNDNLFYFIDKYGIPLGNSAYERAERFSEGMAAVMIDGKWGYINTNGKMLINPKFDMAGNFKDGVAKVLTGNRFAYINTKGNFTYTIFSRANDFSEGLASVENESGYWGFINTNGDFVIKPDFISAGNFVNNLAPVDIGGKFGYINKDGEMAIKPIFQFADNFKNGIAKVWYEDKLFYINTSGEVIWKFELD